MINPHYKIRKVVKKPLFLKFLNNEIDVSEIIKRITYSKDRYTAEVALEKMADPPDIKKFRKEFTEAVSDVVREGLDQEVISFLDYYMAPLQYYPTESYDKKSISCVATINYKSGPWIQGFICFNFSLYVKVFGLSDLKICRVCSRFFDHKGKYAVYCSDECKKAKGIV